MVRQITQAFHDPAATEEVPEGMALLLRELDRGFSRVGVGSIVDDEISAAGVVDHHSDDPITASRHRVADAEAGDRGLHEFRHEPDSPSGSATPW